MAATNDFEKMIIVFTDDKSNYENADLTPEEYIREYVLQNSEGEIKSEKINDNEYFYIEEQYTGSYNNKDYIATTCVVDAKDKLLCIGIDTPADDTLSLKDIIK